jgi:hypothetical protein
VRGSDHHGGCTHKIEGLQQRLVVELGPADGTQLLHPRRQRYLLRLAPACLRRLLLLLLLLLAAATCSSGVGRCRRRYRHLLLGSWPREGSHHILQRAPAAHPLRPHQRLVVDLTALDERQNLREWRLGARLPRGLDPLQPRGKPRGGRRRRHGLPAARERVVYGGGGRAGPTAAVSHLTGSQQSVRRCLSFE